MGFTLKWLTPPWAAFWAVGLWAKTPAKFHEAAPLMLVIFTWIAFATLVVIGYWLARAFRAGTRDSQPR